jgi:hypothetical protein
VTMTLTVPSSISSAKSYCYFPPEATPVTWQRRAAVSVADEPIHIPHDELVALAGHNPPAQWWMDLEEDDCF